MRSLRAIVLVGLVGVLALSLPGRALAQWPAGESIWILKQQDPQTSGWIYVSLLGLRSNGRDLSVEYVFWSIVSDNVTAPDVVRNARLDGQTLAFDGVFGKETDPETGQPTDRDRVLEYRLQRQSDTVFAGMARLAGQDFAAMRIERVAEADMAKVFGEIKAALEVERAVVQAQIAPLRDAVDVLEKEVQRQRSLGRQPDQMLEFQLSTARYSAGREESRFNALSSRLAAVSGVIARLEAVGAMRPDVLGSPADEAITTPPAEPVEPTDAPRRNPLAR